MGRFVLVLQRDSYSFIISSRSGAAHSSSQPAEGAANKRRKRARSYILALGPLIAAFAVGCSTPSHGLVGSAPGPAETPQAATTQPAAETEVAPNRSELAQPAAATDERGEPSAEAKIDSPAPDSETEASEPTEAPAAPADDKPRLYAPQGLVKIHQKADRDSPVIGAFRAGQSVVMTDTTLTKLRERRRLFQCTEGWYPVQPRGFVCVGGPKHATRDGNDPRVLAARAVLPDTTASYPFRFGVSVGSPQYLRIPTAAEQHQTEPDLNKHLANLPAADNAKGGAVSATPAGRPPSKALLHYLASTKLELVHEEKVFTGKKVAWAQEFDAQGRTWLLTPDMTLIPKDTVRAKPLPTLQGIDLRANPDVTLPLAFLWLTDSPKYRIGEDGKAFKTEELWKRHSFVAATTEMARGPGGYYWKLRNGELVKYQDVTIIKKGRRPRGVGPTDKWVEARVTWGFLIAYEGDEPVYVAAMSPGIDGVNKRKHATARGRHFIDWKMLSSDMSGTDKGKFWFVDEVPWVAFYKGNYAVHGAWWHNDFGRPKSHGCVNLPPADARFLFGWMDPVIPEGWYAASSYYPYTKKTLIFIHS